MTTTNDVLDKRLTDLETIVWDLPGLLTKRTTKYEAEFTSISGRLDNIERNQGMLHVDMRDLRNGVARFIAEVDARMRAFETELSGLKAGLSSLGGLVDTRLEKIDAALAELLTRMSAQK